MLGAPRTYIGDLARGERNLTLKSVERLAADASACYNIADADARTYCLARAHRQPGQCYSIQNAAMRSMCLADVRK